MSAASEPKPEKHDIKTPTLDLSTTRENKNILTLFLWDATISFRFTKNHLTNRMDVELINELRN